MCEGLYCSTTRPKGKTFISLPWLRPLWDKANSMRDQAAKCAPLYETNQQHNSPKKKFIISHPMLWPLCVWGSVLLLPPYKPIVALEIRKEKPLFRSLCYGYSVCEGLYSCTTRRANSSLRNQKRETFISLPMLWLLCVWGALLLYHHTSQ